MQKIREILILWIIYINLKDDEVATFVEQSVEAEQFLTVCSSALETLDVALVSSGTFCLQQDFVLQTISLVDNVLGKYTLHRARLSLLGIGNLIHMACSIVLLLSLAVDFDWRRFFCMVIHTHRIRSLFGMSR